MTLTLRRNPSSSRLHRLGGPVPPPPEPTPAERRAVERVAREARQAVLEQERAVKKRVVLALETSRAQYRRRRGCGPEVAWSFVECLRGQGRWDGDEDPDWELPSWMRKGYDPMEHRDYWLSLLPR